MSATDHEPQAMVTGAGDTGTTGRPIGLYYHPDSFVTRRERLMGRHAAGASFLDALLARPDLGPLVCCADTDRFAAVFFETARQAGRSLGLAKASIVRPDQIAAATSTLVIPDPNLPAHAWRRRRFDQRGYALCGMTHTIATAQVLDMIAGLLATPLQPWDALVCTSLAAKAMITSLLDDQMAFFADRLGATIDPRPMLPVVPLGIHADGFRVDQAARAALRAEFGIRPSDLAVLTVGRLDALTKANPVPLCLAVSQAARAARQTVHLVFAGRFPDERHETLFRSSITAASAGVHVHVFDGRREDMAQVHAMADVFALLSDNIQETFGLAPVEAMAAGLPVVVSDWDGYRDTVPHGVAGFRVPVWAPSKPLGIDLALAFETQQWTYDRYVGAVSQFAGLDLGAVVQAFETLFLDADLRRDMGQAAGAHVRASYDWGAVLGGWRALWDEQDAIRLHAAEIAPRRSAGEAVPTRPDPFAAFADWPSALLTADTLVTAEPMGAADRRARLNLPGAAVMPLVLPNADECLAVLDRLDRLGTLPAGEAVAGLSPARTARLLRGLAWLAKLGLVRLDDPGLIGIAPD